MKSMIRSTAAEIDVNLDFSLKILFGYEFGLKDLDLLETLSTGIFGRTRLVRSLKDKQYYALKIMKKSRIVKMDQLEHVQNEVRILSRIRCPFVIDMKALFQDENSVYLLYGYISGGELYSHLRRNKVLDIASYQFYGVEVACALHHLHRLNIVYRDLKPENVLIEKDGHLRLAEFCLAKQITDDRTFTTCGTPEYLAPEVITGNGYGLSVDWWGLGILLHEMVLGFPPFYGKNPFMVYRKILNCKLQLDEAVPKHTTSLITKLLTVERTARLGCGSFEEVRAHSFFQGVDWQSAFQRLMVPPMLPAVASEADTSNFDFYPDEPVEEPNNLTQAQRGMFRALDAVLERPAQVH